MSNMNEDIEKLMNRALDGVLSEEEELSLNRELIRNPEARRLMAEYRAVDELSVAALNDVVAGEAPVFDATTWARSDSWKQNTRPRRTWFWLAPGAIAAALLAMVVGRPTPKNVERSPIVQVPATPTFNGLAGLRNLPESRNLMHSVGSTPAIHRNTGREIIGVEGDDGNLYWIEVERTRTVTLPTGSSSREKRNSL